jgi:5'-3' exonuclease
MGIPSYYKRLIDRFPALVKRGVRSMQSDVLYMDFNCLIYHCLKSQPAYTEVDRAAWEAGLLAAVKKYTVEVWNAAGRPAEVFIGVDGVVPMAKIRQQRLRRFKSRWLAAKEREVGARVGDSWDSNAITPGTEFMEKLGVALKELAAARPGWTVSGADEPGEGEQKLIARVRASHSGKRLVVYGLDADLIVLSLLVVAEGYGTGGWHLLREGGEFGGGGGAGAGAFATLDVRGLLGHLVPTFGKGGGGGGAMTLVDHMHEYVCAMSFLGNDFLPHSLSVKIRDGGHDAMCARLAALHAAGKRLVVGGYVMPAACADFIAEWAASEETLLVEAVRHKYAMRPMVPRTDAERLMSSMQNIPLKWAAEGCLFDGADLKEDWRSVYRRQWLYDAEHAAATYCVGLQWIMDYYTGKPVSYSWYYPWNVAPLWGDLEGELRATGGIVPPSTTTPVAPQEQLAMVLPLESWGLVRDGRLRALPGRAPAFWPTAFGFFSAGRRFLWECEAIIPVMSVERMRLL